MELIYTDLPEYRTREDYDLVIERVVKEYLNDPQIVSVYQTGSIRALGFSDIDLIIIVDDNSSNLKKVREAILEYRKDFPYFFLHEPIVVKENQIHFLKEIYPLFDFKKLVGKNFDLKGEFNSKNSLIHLLNEINVGIFNPALEILVGDNNIKKKIIHLKHKPSIRFIKVRYVLCRLSTFKYFNYLFKNLSGDDFPGAVEFQKEIDYLRQNWFDFEASERLKKVLPLIQKYFSLVIDSIQYLDNYFCNNKLISVEGVEQLEILLLPRINIYSNDWNSASSLKLMNQLYQEKGISASILPLKMAVLPLMISDAEYFFSYHSRKKISEVKFYYPDKEYFQNMRKKIEEIDYFVSSNSLPAKKFSKFHASNKFSRLKRLVVSYLW